MNRTPRGALDQDVDSFGTIAQFCVLGKFSMGKVMQASSSMQQAEHVDFRCRKERSLLERIDRLHRLCGDVLFFFFEVLAPPLAPAGSDFRRSRLEHVASVVGHQC